MKKPILIGIAGRRNSGKNTVAGYIKEWGESNGLKVELQGFADRLKLSFARLFVPDATLEEALEFADYFKVHGELIANGGALPLDIADRFGNMRITGRLALQHYGTESHRDVFGDQFWVDQLVPAFWHIKGPWSDDVDIGVVYDVRFPNEAQRIQEVGGINWSVLRRSAEQNDTHASEQVLSIEYIWDYIENNGTLDELRQEVFFKIGFVTTKQPSQNDYKWASRVNEALTT